MIADNRESVSSLTEGHTLMIDRLLNWLWKRAPFAAALIEDCLPVDRTKIRSGTLVADGLTVGCWVCGWQCKPAAGDDDPDVMWQQHTLTETHRAALLGKTIG